MTSETGDRGSAQVVSALARAYTLSDTFPLHHPRVREAIQSACAGQSEVGIVALDVTEHGFLAENRRMEDATGRLAEFARGLYEAQVEHLRIDGSLSTEAVALFLFCVRQAAANQDVRIADVLACAGAHSIRVAVSDFGAPSAALGQPTQIGDPAPGPSAAPGLPFETSAPFVASQVVEHPTHESFELPVVHNGPPQSGGADPAEDSFATDPHPTDTPSADRVTDLGADAAADEWWSARAPGGANWQEPSESWTSERSAEVDGTTGDPADWSEPASASEWTDLDTGQTESWNDSATQAWPAESEEASASPAADASWAEEMARWDVGTPQTAPDQEFGRNEDPLDWTGRDAADHEPAPLAGDVDTEVQFATPELEAGRVEPDLGEPVPLTIYEYRGSGVLPAADPIHHLEAPTEQGSADPLRATVEDATPVHESQGVAPAVADYAPHPVAAEYPVETSEPIAAPSAAMVQEPTPVLEPAGQLPGAVSDPEGFAAQPEGAFDEDEERGQPQATDGAAVSWVDDDLWVTDHWQAEEFRQALLDGVTGDEPQSIGAGFDADPESALDLSHTIHESIEEKVTSKARHPSVPVVELAPSQAPQPEPQELRSNPATAELGAWSAHTRNALEHEATPLAMANALTAAPRSTVTSPSTDELAVASPPAADREFEANPEAPKVRTAPAQTDSPATILNTARTPTGAEQAQPAAAVETRPVAQKARQSNRVKAPRAAPKAAPQTNPSPGSDAAAKTAPGPAADGTPSSATSPTPATAAPRAQRGVDPAPMNAAPAAVEMQPISSLIQAVHDFIGSDDRDRPEIEQRILAEVRAATAEGPAPVVVDAVETLLYQTATSDRGADSLAGVMVTDDVVIELMERLGEARDEAARSRLTKVGRRLSSDMAPALAEALNAVPPRSVRRNFLNAICTMGRDALRQAIPMLDDSRWFIVRNGVDIIGEVAEPESVPILFPILGHADNRVRVATVRAMAKIGGEDAQINLTRALNDESQDVREAAAMAVGHLKAERALRPLLALLDKEKDEEFQLVLIRSLGQLGSLDAVSHLEKRAVGGLLFRPSKAVRIAAYRALAAIGSPRARQLLVAASEDRDHEVATAARSILARMTTTAQSEQPMSQLPEAAPVG